VTGWVTVERVEQGNVEGVEVLEARWGHTVEGAAVSWFSRSLARLEHEGA
jgi:hypothetical protein